MGEHSKSSRHRDSRSRSPEPSRRDRDSHSRRHHRSRSRSPDRRPSRRDRDRDDDRRRDRGDDSGDEGPPAGVAELDDSDYFLKATELKLWLWKEKGKRLDSLRTEDARRYFKRFCKAWNRGRLDAKFYAGISPASLPSSISTSHSWSFSKASQQELDTAASVRKSIDTGSKVRSYDSSAPVAGPSRPPPGAGGTATLGPTLPPSSAVERLQMDRDARDSARQAERNAASSQRRREARDARDDERDERATGRDRVVEKRREGNASRRAFEAGREGGGMLEFDDEALLGGETGKGGPAGSFQDALRQRDAAQQRRQERKFGKQEERQAEMSDRLSAHRQKEDATMAMFKQLAAQRFGAPPS